MRKENNEKRKGNNEKRKENNEKRKENYKKRTRIDEKRIKRRERAVEGGNNKKEKKRIRACNVVLCLLYCLLYKFYQAVSTPPQLLQSWGQLCPGRGRCDENASLPLI